MPSQSRSFQRDVIAAARDQGILDTLFWYAEIEISSVTGIKYYPASWPGKWIPILRIGDDYQVSQIMTEILGEIFAAANRDKRMKFAPALTTMEAIEETGALWYVWGEAGPLIDQICPNCAQIHQLIPGGWAVCECGCDLATAIVDTQNARNSCDMADEDEVELMDPTTSQLASAEKGRTSSNEG